MVLPERVSQWPHSVGRSQKSRLSVTCDLQELLECGSDTAAVSVRDARSGILSGRLYLRGGKLPKKRGVLQMHWKGRYSSRGDAPLPPAAL